VLALRKPRLAAPLRPAAPALPPPDRSAIRPVWGPGRPWKPTALIEKGKVWKRS